MERAVFLDRDGVINEVHSHRVRYVNHPEDLHLLPNAAKAIRLLGEANYKVFIVTNQGGIGLGYMRLETLLEIHIELLQRLSHAGAYLDDIAYCPHKPRAGCSCRKPRPGMILDLAAKHQVDLKHSYTIGDMDTDIKAGRSAGTRTIRIRSKAERGESHTAYTEKADHEFPSLWKAVQWILDEEPEILN
ncbi:HAD family hydrolase [Paenibacillus zeisoli]|uniref:D,D-heptose 1,7-bisphosphate phosphatase n=1 Tax=Paenibacillus zeisoli TaxID=2496267 RepID=A0A433XRF4_9BACL|nr:HAD family hydrolase [Paenibacillus zeisoli]RUT36548.1 HAD family hydrolase [Paenibacillus zeisoli]